MFSRDRLCQLAVRGFLIGIVLWAGSGPALSQKAEPHAVVPDATTRSTNDDTSAKLPENGGGEDAQTDTDPAPKPLPSAAPAPGQIQPPPAADASSANTQSKNDAAERRRENREKRDLKAQRRMALAAEYLLAISIIGTTVAGIGLILLFRTLRHTRDATAAAFKAAKAAEAAVKAAQRQADAAILVEAAKLAVARAYLSPVGGGGIQKNGIPTNGYKPTVSIKNIGKTRAFILSTCLIMKASLLPPERRYPFASQKQWTVDPGMRAGEIFNIYDTSQKVSLTEEQIAEMRAGKFYLWLFGCIWFKDWFGIPRQHEFLWRWEADTGFIPHEIAT